MAVADEDASRWRRELARGCGLYVGYSAAANVAACVQLAHSPRLRRDASIVSVLCDTGLKYAPDPPAERPRLGAVERTYFRDNTGRVTSRALRGFSPSLRMT